MACSMMQGKHLPKRYWAETIHTAVYILNRSPTKAVKDLTPYEAWHKRKPRVEHPKVFGCVAYAHIPKENWEKLDENGENCIFIGYSQKQKDIASTSLNLILFYILTKLVFCLISYIKVIINVTLLIRWSQGKQASCIH